MTGEVKMMTLRLIGENDMLMQSDTLADPLNPLTKEYKAVYGKRKKTDDDHREIAWLGWRGALYHDEELGPYLPGINIEASFVAGAKLLKLGRQLQRAAMVLEDKCALRYQGPRERDAMWSDEQRRFVDSRAVKVGTSRVIRYRPRFAKGWSAQCTLQYDTMAIDPEQILLCAQNGGMYCGIGDFRPRFGRYSVEVVSHG